MAGQRLRNVAGATSAGVIPYARVCTKPRWRVRDGETAKVIVRGHTGPRHRGPARSSPGERDESGLPRLKEFD